MAGFSGLKIERHQVQPSREVCVWYENGERRGVVYVDGPKKELRVMHEADVRVQVLRRTGLASFEESMKPCKCPNPVEHRGYCLNCEGLL